MADRDLGQGITIESLNIKPSFPFGTGKATLKIGDPIFPDIKGTIKISSGPNAAATVVGQTAMGATASFVLRGPGNLLVGFKQLAFFKFSTAIYAGLKDSDGSITDSSTGLNFVFFLDCAVDNNLNSPQAPFYVPVGSVTSGRPVTIDMPDQPGGTHRLQRRNSLRDRLNFLLSYRVQNEFVTFLVVKRPDGKHVPVEGFTWSYTHSVDLRWASGTPSIASDISKVGFGEKLIDLKAGDQRFDMLANPALGSSDTMVSQFNKAMFAAERKQATSGYEIKEFDNYSPLVTDEMKSRFNNQFN